VFAEQTASEYFNLTLIGMRTDSSNENPAALGSLSRPHLFCFLLEELFGPLAAVQKGDISIEIKKGTFLMRFDIFWARP